MGAVQYKHCSELAYHSCLWGGVINDVTLWVEYSITIAPPGVRPQLTFLIIVSHECSAYEIVKWELNKFILCDMSAFEQEYSQVCL